MCDTSGIYWNVLWKHGVSLLAIVGSFEVRGVKNKMDHRDIEINVMRDEAVRDVSRIESLEESLKELYFIIKDYDIVNSDTELGIEMPNKDKEKMRRAERLLSINKP